MVSVERPKAKTNEKFASREKIRNWKTGLTVIILVFVSTDNTSLLRRHLLIVENLYNLVIQITDVLIGLPVGKYHEMPAEEAMITLTSTLIILEFTKNLIHNCLLNFSIEINTEEKCLTGMQPLSKP